MTPSTETKRGPGRPRSLTVATEKTIARRYASGKWTLAALAEHYSIAVGTVRAIIKRNPTETNGAEPHAAQLDAELAQTTDAAARPGPYDVGYSELESVPADY